MRRLKLSATAAMRCTGFAVASTACAAMLTPAFIAQASGPLRAASERADTPALSVIDNGSAGIGFNTGRLADRQAPPLVGLRPIVLAQQGGFSVSDIAGPAGEELPIDVSMPPDNGELFRVVMIRGLPEGFKLTAGVSLDDSWAVSPGEVSRAALVAPKGYAGDFSMEVLFIRGNGEAREQHIVNVRIGPERETDTAANANAEVTASNDAAPQAKTPSIDPALQRTMFERATRMMRGGDISGARLILRYLAEQGMAGAAFAMGQSFDPGFLQDIYVRGDDPSDTAQAREWYTRAAQMGNTDAEARLSALE